MGGGRVQDDFSHSQCVRMWCKLRATLLCYVKAQYAIVMPCIVYHYTLKLNLKCVVFKSLIFNAQGEVFKPL